ncbi:MAG: AsmA family protein [Alphaproteobacteria bacterium]|nr:AsmA family protein [Alphaproteobacteria bacterium]
MRWIVRLIGAVVVLVLLAVGVVSLIPAEKIAALAAREISASTGREVAFSGKIKPVFYPVLGIKTEDFSIGNADWSDGTPMLVADSLLVGVELIPLFSGQVRIREFRLEGAVIRLERAADGQVNWALGQQGAADAAPSEGSGLPQISLKDGRIVDGSVSYFDRQSGTTLSLDAINLAVALPDFAGKARAKGDARYNGQKLGFDLDLNSLSALLDGKLADVNLALSGDFGTMSYKGRAGLDPVVAEGAVEAKITDLAALGALAGQEDALAGLAKSAALSGKLTYSEAGDLFLRGAEITLDENRLTGDIDLAMQEPPMLTAKLVAGELDFSSFAGGSGSNASSTETGWSTTEIDLTALHALDADIGFAAASINLGMARLGETRLRATLDRGRLVIGLKKVAAYQGSVSGEFVVNARGGLSMGGNLALKGVQLQPLLREMADYDRLIAGASGQVKFLTSGNSVDAMMNRLSGSGRIDIGAGEIIGLDLLGMLRNLDASYRGADNKTIFSAITGSFTIKDGVLANDDLKFASGLVDATGAGQVDIGAQKLTYRVVPVAFSGKDVASAGGLSVPVLISGPWSDLSFRPDLQGLFDGELAKQREALEARAKENVQKIKAETEQRLRDEADKAIKKSLEDALKKSLGLP